MEQTAATLTTTEEKWHGSPVTCYRGPLEKIRDYIPTFARRSFGPDLTAPPCCREQPSLFQYPPTPAGINPQYDAIVRLPLAHEEKNAPEVPVGIVSPQYTLLQHQTVVDEVLKTLDELEIDAKQVKAIMDLTHFGERMRLSLIFPEKFDLCQEQTHRTALRLECFNSVEGSTRFMAVIGWLRFVCSNGLIIGETKTDYRRRHNRDMDIHEIVEVLRDGIEATTREKRIYEEWMGRAVAKETFRKWVDEFLAKRWGVKAAVRTWHITLHGYDMSLADPFESGKSTEKSIIQGAAVPGAVLSGDKVFAVVQALAWLAKERRDVQEQLSWKQQIPELIQPLLG